MSEWNLQIVANIAQIVGAGTIITALVFGSFQIREYRKRRENAVAVELMRSFYSPDFARAMSLVRLLPDAVSAEDLRARGPDFEQAAILIATTFETMGLLAYRNIAPFSLVKELAGGVTVVMWKKLSVWLETIREEQAQPSWAEWFQWLAEQLVKVQKPESLPAHLKFKDWRP